MGWEVELSRTNLVSRQTLYRWKEKGEQALHLALENPPILAKPTKPIHLLVLTLLIETHASYRNIQASLKKGLCCKNCEELKKCVKRVIWFSLNGHSKQSGDQCHLSSHVSFCHLLHLSFPYHVHHLIAL